MGTIFVNSKNSVTPNLQRLLLELIDITEKVLHYQILAFTKHGKT